MFKQCCSTPHIEKYLLQHTSRPFPFGADTEKKLKTLLLYVPNIDSVQAKQIPELDNTLYDEPIFSFIMEKLGVIENDDVVFKDSSDQVEQADWDFYHDNFCTNCQKIIMCAAKGQTKTHNLLRGIRNMLAHGDYFVDGDIIIGFNEQHSKHNAVIKINLSLLLDALAEMGAMDENLLIASNCIKKVMLLRALKEIEYTDVTSDWTHRINCDIAVEKNGITYFLEFKRFPGVRYLHIHDLGSPVCNEVPLEPNQRYVVVIDTSTTTKELMKVWSEFSRYKILDVKAIKKLFSGEDVLQKLEDIIV